VPRSKCADALRSNVFGLLSAGHDVDGLIARISRFVILFWNILCVVWRLARYYSKRQGLVLMSATILGDVERPASKLDPILAKHAAQDFHNVGPKRVFSSTY
jgi:hypothetical protein